MSSIEVPSGKDADYENFPVGSFLLPKHLRPHISVFYRFARAIDDIADAPELSADEKVSRLDGFAAALHGDNPKDAAYETGHAMRISLTATNVPIVHGLDLIDAFKQDARQARYRTWEDLMSYCDRSASPVGRYLIDLHGGFKNPGDGYRASDALCNALQVINHLQDAQEDYRDLDRVYLPTDWLDEAGAAIDELDQARISPAMRRVFDQCLDGTEALLHQAAALSPGLVSRRLSCETAAILEIAWRLVRALRQNDPLAGKVKLSKFGYAGCCALGVLRELSGRRRT